MTDDGGVDSGGDFVAEQERFGAFLVRRGTISREELNTALQKQEDINTRVGVLAMNRGMLTQEEVWSVLEEQRQTGELFGICAVRRGLLQPGQVDGLLAEQKDQNLKVGELLVLARVLTFEELQAALEEFGYAPEAESMAQRFGEFLVGCGVVTQAQLDEALGIQEKNAIRIGAMARHAKLLSNLQVHQVLERQRQTGERFGVAAAALGFSRAEAFDALQVQQTDSIPMLGHTLVLLNYLDENALAQALRDYGA